MNIKEFAKELSKHNEKDKRWSIISFITFIFTGLVGVDETNMFGKIGFPVCGSIMIIFFTMHYLKRYLSIMFYMGFTTDNDYIYGIAKTQAFQPKKYFAFLRKKLVLWQAIFFFIASVTFIMHKNYIGVLIAAFMGAIPMLVCLLYEKRFKKEICTRNQTWEEIVGGILKGIISVFEIFISILYMLLGFLFVWAIISDIFVGGLDENVILYKTYESGASFGAVLFSFIILVCFWMIPIKKKISIIRTILLVVVIGCGIVDIVMGKNLYTEIYEDKIIVSNFERKREYSIDEIQSFKVYEEDGEFQVKVTFKDGFCETLFGSVATNTEVFDEKYYSECNFMADMIPKFIENGAKGEIDMEDMEEIKEYKVNYDEEIMGIEKIIEVMS